ncbi:putative bifunctional diguanylate cyclase/phosphodiesterase [Pseudoxanthomonas wuyuanensis]|uniref:cyclic-guanylate-specific phosphodiesterase n=1 Tax=Pseudoxanthomonas wuyuanensis TaxID=1073196 RepID=A0A286D3C4_9GAMM|nr:EAL domain-containing protein [Pseudoxanthomonas wuyuanensis]KAF1722979.1 GGDEF domain-containing protein [Pseudoxanthomonas wuyuanensis]SOD53151.1 PAS domain S-box-containing protein/diguanylate cyclase (GGDEF) domain-containing protein [Pseudoxanthomonas wuyuanensis]
MPIALVAAVSATAFPASPLWPRLPLILLAGAALLAVIAIATRRHWQPWLKTRRQPVETLRSEALRVRDERLKLALWASGEQFWDYDLIQRKLYRMRTEEVSAQAADITVSTRHGEVPPIHPEDLPLVMERLRVHLQGRTPLFMSEHRMDLHNNGRWAWIRARGRVVERDADSRPIRIAGTARDITTSRNAEYEHRIADEVMRSMNEAVAVLDWAQQYVTINPAFTRITGYSGDEIVGQPANMLDSGQHDEAFFDRMEAELQHTGHWSGEVWKVRKDGEEILCRIETNVVPDACGERQLYVQVLTDITEQKRAEQELRYLANYDTLTSLPNRSLLSERLSRAIVRARREHGHVAVLFIDLDRFKDINDSLGHATGDRILRAAAARVQQTVGAEHTVARLSGDEFTVVLEDLDSVGDAEEVAQRIIEAFKSPLNFGERLEMSVSPSIGISLYPQHAQVPTELLKHADTAMYQAKAMGRHTYKVYSETMDEKNRHRAILASALRRALDRNELSLAYQPRLALAQNRITGVEALLRWQSPEFGEVSPGQFIPLAEETGLILEIGAWALREACLTLKQWHASGLEQLTVSVNVSANQLQRGDLPELVARTLAETGIAPARLELELTESVIMADPEQNADTLRACRRLGISLAIDDFGTGYSSLAYLKRLPLTTLKIDQEFISDLTHDSDDEAITSTIITMGQSLALRVVAEGVETYDQYEFLRNHGCDEVQGHWVSQALTPEQCLRFIREYYPGSGVRAAS